MCGSTCATLDRDPENCGACGIKCGALQVCSSGACASGCAGGSTQCAQACVDTKTDPANCGACGTTCKTDETCSAGSCTPTCGKTQTACATDAGLLCTDTAVDPENCGGCGTPCAAVANANAVCTNSACGFVCTTTHADCNEVASDGCEVDLSSTQTSCGKCGNVCNYGSCASSKCPEQAVDLTPPSGTLVDPGNTVVWAIRGYTVTFSTAANITGVEWKANLALADTITSEIWDPATQTKVATGAVVNGAGSAQFYRTNISFTPIPGKAYIVAVLISNINTVFPRKDTPSFPYTTSNIVVSACWAEGSDAFPTLANVWGPMMHIDAD